MSLGVPVRSRHQHIALDRARSLCPVREPRHSAQCHCCLGIGKAPPLVLGRAFLVSKMMARHRGCDPWHWNSCDLYVWGGYDYKSVHAGPCPRAKWVGYHPSYRARGIPPQRSPEACESHPVCWFCCPGCSQSECWRRRVVYRRNRTHRERRAAKGAKGTVADAAGGY
jgi:hypothetical protein